MHKKVKNCLCSLSKGKTVTYFSDTFFQCSPRYRSTHWFERSDHRSYKGGCKQLVKGKQKFCALKSHRGSTLPKYRLLIWVPVLGDQSAEAFFFSWGREDVSRKGDLGRCLARDPDYFLFVERM